MAKKQQIILTHGSGAPTFNKDVVKQGEVWVRHAADAKEAALYTPNNDETAFLEFPSKAYVDDKIKTINDADFGGKINALETAYKAADKEINDKIGSGFTATNTVAKAISDEADARTEADAAINAKIGGNYTEDSTVADAIAAEASTREGADNALQGEIDKKVDNDTYTTKVGQIDTSINTLNDIVDGYTGKSSIKTAVDSKVAQTDYDTKVGQIEGNITAIQGTLSKLDETYATDTQLTNAVNTLNTSIAAAKTTITEANPEAGIKVVKTTPTAKDGHDNYEISLVGIATGSDLDALTGKVTTLIGNDENKSAREIVQDEVATQLKAEGISESFDTLTEMAQWLSNHPKDVTDMNNKITANTEAIGEGFSKTNTIASAISGIQGQINKLDETYATDTDLSGAITTLEGKITAAQNKATTTIVEGTDASNNLTITEGTGADGGKEYTISLTNVAKADDLTGETAAREAADTAINEKIGGNYTKDNTVAAAIAAEVKAREDADKAINDKIGTVAEGQTVVGLIAAEASARETADNGLSGRIDTINSAYVKTIKYKKANGEYEELNAVNNVIDLSGMVIDGGTY